MTCESTVRTDDGVSLHVVVDGPENGMPLLLSNSLGTDSSMWEPQMPALSEKFRVVRYDTRGHGQSESPIGEYTIARLGLDAIAVARSLGWTSFNFAGVSMGGMTGLWLAANQPESIRRALVSNCAPFAGGPSVWAERMEMVKRDGMASISAMVVGRWFSPTYAAAHPEVIARISAGFEATSAAGYLGCCAALRDMDLRADLSKIARPVLVIGGEHDPTPPPAAIPGIADAIAGAKWSMVNAAHLSNIEDADGYTTAMLKFFA